MKPSRLIAGMIAALCGVGVGLVAFLAVSQDTGELVRSEPVLRFVLGRPLDLLAEPFTTETNDIYDKNLKRHNRRSVLNWRGLT